MKDITNPPPTEVWSGKSLNDLIYELGKLPPGAPGPLEAASTSAQNSGSKTPQFPYRLRNTTKTVSHSLNCRRGVARGIAGSSSSGTARCGRAVSAYCNL